MRAGWRGESSRHSLARRGIKTGKSDGAAYSMFNKSKSPHDHALFAAGQKQEVHHYLYKLTETKKEDNPEHVKQLEKAQEEIKHITTLGKLKEWFHRHRHTLELVGITGLLFAVSAAAGGAGGLFMNTVTGEIVHMGGTALGQAATTAGVAVGGFGLGEGAREALIAAQESKIEEKMRKAGTPKEFEKLKKEEEALEESEKVFGRKSGEVPVFEEGLQAKGIKSYVRIVKKFPKGYLDVDATLTKEDALKSASRYKPEYHPVIVKEKTSVLGGKKALLGMTYNYTVAIENKHKIFVNPLVAKGIMRKSG
jgi:hypothetical protein